MARLVGATGDWRRATISGSLMFTLLAIEYSLCSKSKKRKEINRVRYHNRILSRCLTQLIVTRIGVVGLKKAGKPGCSATIIPS